MTIWTGGTRILSAALLILGCILWPGSALADGREFTAAEPAQVFEELGIRPRANYVILLDLSSSMSGLRFQTAHRAASALLQELQARHPHDRTALVTFTTSAQTASTGLTTPAAALNALGRVRPSSVGGGTSIGAGFQEGLAVLRAGQQQPDLRAPGLVTILFSDAFDGSTSSTLWDRLKAEVDGLRGQTVDGLNVRVSGYAYDFSGCALQDRASGGDQCAAARGAQLTARVMGAEHTTTPSADDLASVLTGLPDLMAAQQAGELLKGDLAAVREGRALKVGTRLVAPGPDGAPAGTMKITFTSRTEKLPLHADVRLSAPRLRGFSVEKGAKTSVEVPPGRTASLEIPVRWRSGGPLPRLITGWWNPAEAHAEIRVATRYSRVVELRSGPDKPYPGSPERPIRVTAVEDWSKTLWIAAAGVSAVVVLLLVLLVLRLLGLPTVVSVQTDRGTRRRLRQWRSRKMHHKRVPGLPFVEITRRGRPSVRNPVEVKAWPSDTTRRSLADRNPFSVRLSPTSGRKRLAEPDGFTFWLGRREP